MVGVRATLFIAVLGTGLSTLWLVFSPVRHLRELPAATNDLAVIKFLFTGHPHLL